MRDSLVTRFQSDRSQSDLGGGARRAFPPAWLAAPYRHGLKRGLDLLLVLLAAPIALIVIALAALAVWLDGGAPFYSQLRIGRGGRIFRLWKNRTMVRNAESLLEQHLARDPALRREWEERQKLDPDPRVTRTGRFLRRTSLDELPQLWNVLLGEMSLVGPRPILPEQRAIYSGQAYYRLRPGLTGSWQISGRNALSFRARASFDESYDRELNLLLDLRILLKTGRIILRATGR